MNKPDSLRQALNQGIEYLASNPDALQLYVDKGAVVSSGVPANGWEYRYTLNVVITDYAGDQNIVMAVVCNWLSNHQPDALNNPELREKIFRFEVDILRNDLVDIAIYLTLTERVIVTESGGIATVAAVTEPDEPEIWLDHHHG
ncbi:phage tail protein [Phytobacter sp. SCO41]|uniref:phage tail protein n=1 Tax=Phytobacter sp. SCO41 TaxID=1756993 RepID=UPI000D500FFD|nr:phage tail protein [Phytobacter sp. SCO41]